MILGSPNMAGTVKRFSQTGLLERTYGPTSTTSDGMLAAGAPVDVPIVAHLFPARGNDVQRLELQSGGATYEIHVPERDRLRSVQKGSPARGTVIIWQARTFEVVALGEWIGSSNGAGGYQQAWVQEVKR